MEVNYDEQNDEMHLKSTDDDHKTNDNILTESTVSETPSAKLFKTFNSDLSSKELHIEIDHHNISISFHFEIYFAYKCVHIYIKIVCGNDGCDNAFYEEQKRK